MEGWADDSLLLNWQPSGPDFWIEWQGQGRLSYTLQQTVPAGPGNVRLRRHLRGCERAEDGRWRVPRGMEFTIELHSDCEGFLFSPYPSGCLPVRRCTHSQQDLGGIIRSYQTDTELRAGGAGLYHLPPAWIECWGEDYGRTEAELLEVYE